MNERLAHAVCPSCAGRNVRRFFDMPDMPTHVNFLWATEAEALACPRGDIRLVFCPECGLITNAAFDASRLEYREGYENSLHYSGVFQEYAEELAAALVDRFDLHNRDIIEVGCGRGDFLCMLCAKGDNRGVGFDPSHTSPPPQCGKDVSFVRDLYSERYAERSADFVCSRHTLEHVQSPADLLGPIRRSIGGREQTAVFFEVPNTLYTLRETFVWDIIYEHVNYFTAASLDFAVRAAGFRPTDVYETFGGQYLCIEAVADSGVEQEEVGKRTGHDVDSLAREVSDFSARHSAYMSEWGKRLDSLAASGRSAAIWGAGSKGVTFLNLFASADRIRYAIDVNPNKRGMFIAGSGVEIGPPERLLGEPVDVIIVANPIYRTEIEAQTRRLGVDAEFMCL